MAALQAINSEEESLLSEEQSHSENLESLKQSERECFDALGDTILASHEKERAQSEVLFSPRLCGWSHRWFCWLQLLLAERGSYPPEAAGGKDRIS